jgi:hypothetical protein
VLITVEEAYIHCAKHIPRMQKVEEEVRQWGTDDVRAKGGDYFQAKSSPGGYDDPHVDDPRDDEGQGDKAVPTLPAPAIPKIDSE